MIHSPQISPSRPNDPSVPAPPSWLQEIGDFPDHFHGYVWSAGVMPNNYLFFFRQREEYFRPVSVTHNLHHRWELVVNYSGEGRVCLEDTVYDFAPGQAFLIKPGTFHRYFGVSSGSFSWLFFTFDLALEQALAFVPQKPSKPTADDLGTIESATQLYMNPYSEMDIFECGLRMGRFCQALSRRESAQPSTGLSDGDKEACELLQRIAHFVDQFMDTALRIDDIARHLEMSESHLRKIFRDCFGVSLGNYLRNSRLTRGVQLIGRSELSVSDVAKSCGFESIFSFSQSFSRAIGMSPSAYRRHLQDGKAPIRVPLSQ